MRTSAITLIMLMLSFGAHGAESIKFSSGIMPMIEFLNQVSNRLKISIEASSVGKPLKTQIHVESDPFADREDALTYVHSVLAFHDLTLVHDEVTDVYRLQRVRDARDSGLSIVTEPEKLPHSDVLVTYVHKLNHVAPGSFARLLRSFAPAYSRLIPSDMTQSVMITDRASSARKYIEMAKKLDLPEVAREFSREVAQASERKESECEIMAGTTVGPGVIYVIIGVLALMIGFSARGYLIRKIEGGL